MNKWWDDNIVCTFDDNIICGAIGACEICSHYPKKTHSSQLERENCKQISIEELLNEEEKASK